MIPRHLIATKADPAYIEPPTDAQLAAGPNGGFEGELSTRDLNTIRRAMKEGWPVTGEMRQMLVSKIHDQIEKCDNAEDRSFMLRAAEVMIRMDTVNLSAAEVADRVDRLNAGTATERQDMTITFEIVDRRGADDRKRIEAEVPAEQT